MSNEFYISDTHFSHENIIKFEAEARPFKTIEEHDEELIRRWNDTVSPNDTVYHLGDVVFKPATQLDKILPRLNGIKHMKFGNHDKDAAQAYLKYFKTVGANMDFVIGNRKVVCGHYPVHPDEIDFRYVACVHGHKHSKLVKIQGTDIPDPRYINICVEHTDLRPISREELVSRIGKGLTAWDALNPKKG